LVYMLVPGIILLFAAYKSFLREEV